MLQRNQAGVLMKPHVIHPWTFEKVILIKPPTVKASLNWIFSFLYHKLREYDNEQTLNVG